MNSLDKIVGWINPARGFRRAQYRQAMQAMNAYEGASKGRRTENWRSSRGSVNTETRSALETLRNRSRDLVRNNPYAASAAREIPAHIIGTGIIPQATGPNAERAEELARGWFDTTECDASGQNHFYGLQQLAWRTLVESGEVIIRRRRRRPADGLTVPLQLQVMEPDHLDTYQDGVTTERGNLVIQGVEFDQIGRRVAYWLFPEHPGDYYGALRGLKSQRVPAEDVIHLYRVDRPGQVRGVPWAAPVILRLRDFDEYEDAQLVRQKVAACFTAFYSESEFAKQGDDSELPEKLEPGNLERLPPGSDVKFANPPAAEGYADYSRVTLHAISAGFGVPYAILTNDLSQVNFSSGRMGYISFWRDVSQWQHNITVPRLCTPVWRWFMEAARAQGEIAGPAQARWTPPRREMVDPSREVPAMRDAVRSGQMTLYEQIRQHGEDPDVFLAEVAEGNRRLDDLGLVFDSDPRRVSRAGLTQARAEGSEISWEEGNGEEASEE